ncbi:MAG TPA: glycosyltransferase family 2 protein [Candidatus Aquilonibacter sp.]|nr:glycosyltransferase family 2 protein [Candidatus Aquilonibacter sp.]
MNNRLPSVTIIIAAKPGQPEIKAVAASRQLDYPPELLEIIVARGKQPSVQRNTAMRAARGELIYFLDDDSVAPADNLRRAAAHFSDSKVQIVGGPNLCPPDAPVLEKIFALVLASWIAFGPSRARYTPVGKLRDTGEKELILCNLAARRETMLGLDGFNEALYPNEENALMDEIQKRGGRLVYDPDFIVHRRPRHSIKAFAKMLMTYGRGRAEQFRVHPTPGSVLNFAPPLFCLFLIALPFLVVLPIVGKISLAALGIYAFAILVQAAALLPRGGVLKSLAAIPFIVLTHVLYGLGFWRGMFTKLNRGGKKSSVEVVLETIAR